MIKLTQLQRDKFNEIIAEAQKVMNESETTEKNAEYKIMQDAYNTLISVQAYIKEQHGTKEAQEMQRKTGKWARLPK